MEKLKRIVKQNQTYAEFCAIFRDRYATLSEAEREAEYKIHCDPAVRYYENKTYNVTVRPLPNGMEHISISLKDRGIMKGKRWRDFQEIKNQVVGEERIALEVYPAESTLVDSANQYHLWVMPEGQELPFGYNYRSVFQGTGKPDSSHAVQEPFSPGQMKKIEKRNEKYGNRV